MGKKSLRVLRPLVLLTPVGIFYVPVNLARNFIATTPRCAFWEILLTNLAQPAKLSR